MHILFRIFRKNVKIRSLPICEYLCQSKNDNTTSCFMQQMNILIWMNNHLQSYYPYVSPEPRIYLLCNVVAFCILSLLLTTDNNTMPSYIENQTSSKQHNISRRCSDHFRPLRIPPPLNRVTSFNRYNRPIYIYILTTKLTKYLHMFIC